MTNFWDDISSENMHEKHPVAFLTSKKIAATLGCSERHIRRLVANGEFPKPVRLGRLCRWPKVVFEDWARKHGRL